MASRESKRLRVCLLGCTVLGLILPGSFGCRTHSAEPAASPETSARTLEPFLRLKLGMTAEEVAAIIPFEPLGNIGSGLWIDAYLLDDGSWVHVAYGGNSLNYVKHGEVWIVM